MVVADKQSHMFWPQHPNTMQPFTSLRRIVCLVYDESSQPLRNQQIYCARNKPPCDQHIWTFLHFPYLISLVVADEPYRPEFDHTLKLFKRLLTPAELESSWYNFLGELHKR